jgi:hypothetical protein
MKEYPRVDEEWNQIHPEDLWVYNKLFLSRRLGYNCGPFGTSVPKPDYYIIRPSINLMGMGRFARKRFIFPQTEGYFEAYDMNPAEFWCEIFEGEHLSVDFQNKEPKLIVLGTRDDKDLYYKWKKWEKVERNVIFPEILNKLVGKYEWINCEFIGKKLIEVHFRRNPDFQYENSVVIPIWEDNNNQNLNTSGLKFVSDSDYYRKGFWVK